MAVIMLLNYGKNTYGYEVAHGHRHVQSIITACYPKSKHNAECSSEEYLQWQVQRDFYAVRRLSDIRLLSRFMSTLVICS